MDKGNGVITREKEKGRRTDNMGTHKKEQKKIMERK
jgi:hypothetical protein